jgi:hypothetical protein
VDQIQFCETHWPVWEEVAGGPPAIGLAASEVTLLKTLTGASRARYEAARAAREASKAATLGYYSAVTAMRSQAATMLAAIKSFADGQDNPSSVYIAAQIPPPAAPTPATPPGKPTGFLVTLEPTGAVSLSWDAENAAASSGGFFTISRKLPGTGNAFFSIGGTPGTTSRSRRMSFTDESVPAAAASAGVQYIVQGRRGTLVGLPSDALTVQFGVDGTGFSVLGGTALKMAA